MGVIRENQQTKLSFKGKDGIEKELNCLVKGIYNDRITLQCSKEVLDNAEYLQEGDEVSVKIFTPIGIKLYDALIINSPLEGDFTIEFVEDYLKEIQRRKYLRVSYKTKVILLREKGNIIVYTSDIGGGGIRFSCDTAIRDGQVINCMIYLPPQITSVKAKGVILKDEHLAPDEYVLTFTKIDEFDREKIIKKTVELSAQNLI